MRRDRSEYGDAGTFCKCLRFARAIILVDHQARYTNVAAQLAEVLDGRAHVVGHVQRLQVVGANDDDFLAHVARNGQAESATNDVTQEIEQHEVEAPFVKSQLLQQLEAGEPFQMDVQHQAVRHLRKTGVEKLLRGRERPGLVTGRAQQSWQRTPDGEIVVHDRDPGGFQHRVTASNRRQTVAI